MSFALYYQMIGRGVRIHDKKTNTVVIDLSENYKRFGKIEIKEIV
jgi:superfamily II DNA or RNA helicase